MCAPVLDDITSRIRCPGERAHNPPPPRCVVGDDARRTKRNSSSSDHPISHTRAPTRQTAARWRDRICSCITHATLFVLYRAQSPAPVAQQTSITASVICLPAIASSGSCVSYSPTTDVVSHTILYFTTSMVATYNKQQT